ncbi:MAG TPA: zinc dependent phospholipase C family protein [Longimicrobium sp.]
MPSLGIHYLVLDEFVTRLRHSSDPMERALANHMEANPAMASLGAIGPDVFYYMDSPAGIVASIADVFDVLNQVGGILDSAADLSGKIGFPNAANLLKQLGETAKLKIANLEARLEAAVININDLVTGHYIMGHSAIQENEPETKWKWGDLVHDRVSGVLARSIGNRARNSGNSAWIAFATGYVTHLATDFTGHPYVNQCVGGPARGYLMRHTVAEKFMDAKVFSDRGQDINTSKLHRRTEPLLHTTQLDNLCQMLSAELAALAPFASTHGYSLPPTPTQNQIRDAVENMNSLFRLVTEQSIVPPPIAPSIAIPPLPGQYGSITNAIGGLFPPSGSPRSLTDWLKLLLALLVSLPALLVDIARFFADLAAGVVLYPLEAALYLLQSILYRSYRITRWFLVVSGVAFPLRDEINSSIGRQFITCRHPSGGDDYPRVPHAVRSWRARFQAVGRLLEFEATDLDYLHYPTGELERPIVEPSPYRQGVTPDYFISELQPDHSYVSQWTSVSTPTDLSKLPRVVPKASDPQVAGFGNAIEFSLMYIHMPSMFDNINLDSDRGYAYKQWRCDGGIGTGDLVNERFL